MKIYASIVSVRGLKTPTQQEKLRQAEELLARIGNRKLHKIRPHHLARAIRDVWDRHLHVVQDKTGERIALPLSLRLKAIDTSLGDVIARCREAGVPGETLLRKSTGGPVSASSLTKAFAGAFRVAVDWRRPGKEPPVLAETRSLAERLYSAQGVDTKTLLGHRRASTTALYHDDRGLLRESGGWRVLRL